MASRFHTLRIDTVRPLTADALAVRFAVPDALAATFDFVPGQYVTLRATLGGIDVRRAYSICSRPDGRGFEVGIRRVVGGAFSNHAATLASGDTLAVMPPEGRFVARPGDVRRVLLVAAGSGITPCLSIATALLHEDPASRVTLLYGNRDVSSVMFRAELDALKDRFTERFVLLHALSREPRELGLLSGRLSGEMLMALDAHGLVDLQASEAIYLCGPEPMADDIARRLSAAGVAPERVRRELFANAAAATGAGSALAAEAAAAPAAVPAAGSATAPEVGNDAPAEPGTDADVEIVLDGGRRRIRVDGARETVLAAAARQGLELPFSCAGGMCCTCRCRIVAGAAAMDANYSLQAWELDAGFTLACQSRPTTARLVLDFDAR